VSVDRRTFIKGAAVAGSLAVFGWGYGDTLRRMFDYTAGEPVPADPVVGPEGYLHTVCLQCNTGCPIKVKVVNGQAIKIEGSPYSPWNRIAWLPYGTTLAEAVDEFGRLCPKGQAGLQTAYDDRRITKVLKRAGPRGSNRWKTIEFDEAIDEIVNGGALFSDVPGEESRVVPGLKDIWALRDPALAAAMAADVKAIEKKTMTVDEFKAKYTAADLSLLIDPDHPDLGPKNNQLVFAWGRIKGGRREWIDYFAKDGMGSTNLHGHTTVCQGSLYFTCKAMSEQLIDGKWSGGAKFYWQADEGSAEFILFVGASPFEGNYGPTNRGSRIADGLYTGRLKYAVADPRFSKVAAKAWKWLPIKPGTEAGLAMALIRYVLENGKQNTAYLANANKAAATADGEPNWCNATWLVKTVNGVPDKFLHASEIGLRDPETRTGSDGNPYTFDYYVVMNGGSPAAFDPNDTTNAAEGDLFYSGELNGIQVKTALQILFEASQERTIEEWSALCGLETADILAVAQEFTSHGRKAVADVHRGVSQHTNGFYNVFSWFALNLLMGNYDYQGGLAKATTYDYSGAKAGQPFNISAMRSGKIPPFGISIIRHEKKYEDSTIFTGYPADRQWYPLASDIWQEIVPSIGDAYPYAVQALILYMGTPTYSLPAGHTNIAILRDVTKLPLFVSIDITVGESSRYADYIIPDLTYLERWEFGGSHPNIVAKVQPVRQPVIPPRTETVAVFGEAQPICFESFILAAAEKLGLPGFGPDGLGAGVPCTRQEHIYLRMAANLAAGDSAAELVPDEDDAGVQTFLAGRSGLPSTIYDAARWEAIVGSDWWRKTIYVLNRGGRFQDAGAVYSGTRLANRYGRLINIYSEKAVGYRNAITGVKLAGYPHYRPIADLEGNPLDDTGYDLNLITYRVIEHTKSRTIANAWLRELLPENYLLINRLDAEAKGIADGDLLRVSSATNPEGRADIGAEGAGEMLEMTIKAKVVEGIRPGVVAFSLGHGHWAYGATDMVVDGVTVAGDPARARGRHLNPVMRIDPYLGNTCLVDPVGGSAVFYDTKVKVEKVV